jgi:uncharacterized membrane protein
MAKKLKNKNKCYKMAKKLKNKNKCYKMATDLVAAAEVDAATGRGDGVNGQVRIDRDREIWGRFYESVPAVIYEKY